jgi:hypothetical protein
MKFQWKRYKRLIRTLVYRKKSSREIAAGVTVGVVTGIMFPYGTHMVLAYLFARILKVDKLAAILGTFANNPMIAAPFYYGAWKMGNLIYAPTLSKKVFPKIQDANFSAFFWDLVALGPYAFLVMVLGLLMFAFILGPLAYFLTYYVIEFLRSRLKDRLQVKMTL